MKILTISLIMLSLTAFAGRSPTDENNLIPLIDWDLSGGVGFYYNKNATENALIEISTIETDSLVQQHQHRFPSLNLSLKKAFSQLLR